MTSQSDIDASCLTQIYSTLPARQNNHNSSICSLEDAYCNLQGPGHALDGLEDPCVLWDPSCSGDEATAADDFFALSITKSLIRNTCFLDSSPDCTTSNPPGRMSAFQEVKSWMRSPECFDLEHSLFPCLLRGPELRQNKILNITCCGNCKVAVDKVEVYYWPEPDADTSCESIVGSEVKRADDGATTDDYGEPYWGCTSRISEYTEYGIEGTTTLTTDSWSIIRTARLTSIAGFEYKVYNFDPFGESPCGNESLPLSSDQTQTAYSSSRSPSLQPRGHSLVISSNASTMIVGTYTVTSPSIYVDFQGLTASDQCGSTSIASTILGFAPGELSTIVGPMREDFSTSRVFNPADLPCPPKSIMHENWYIPLPGVPYRPFFAFPEKLREVIPDFKYCNAFFFHAFDPPRTLRPVDALSPQVTSQEPKVTSQAPMPSATQDPVPIKTHLSVDPIVSIFAQPAHSHTVEDPQPTAINPLIDPFSVDPGLSKQSSQHSSTIELIEASARSTFAQSGNNIQSAASPEAVSQPGQTATASGWYSAISSTIASRTHVENSHEEPNSVHTQSAADRHQTVSQSDSTTSNPFASFIMAPFVRTEISSHQSDIMASDEVHKTTIQLGTTVGYTMSDASIATIANALSSSEVNIATTPVMIEPLGDLIAGNGPSRSASSVLLIAGNTVTANPKSVDIGSTHVQVGEPAITVSGVVLSLGESGNLVVWGSAEKPTAVVSGGQAHTDSIASQTLAPLLITTNDATMTVKPNSNVAVDGNTLEIGGQGINMDGGPSVSVGSAGLLIGTKTIPQEAPTPVHSVITTTGETFTFIQQSMVAVNGTTLSVGGQGAILSNGGQGATVSGVTVSMGSAGIVIGAETVPLHAPTPTVLTADGLVVTLQGNTRVALDGITLTQGGAEVKVSGVPVSAVPSGLVVGSDTVPLQAPRPTPIVITTDGQTVTFEENSRVAIDGTTLSIGGQDVTVDGATVSLGSSELIIGTDRITLPLGTVSTTSSVATFTGPGSKVASLPGVVLWGLMGALVVVLS